MLRVFTDSDGNFGNPLGVINASKVEHRDRQQLAAQSGYSETIFVDLPSPGSTTAHATIHTPRTEIPFAGHPTVGASWWLRERGTPINTLQVPAGIVQVSYHVISPPSAPARNGHPSSPSTTWIHLMRLPPPTPPTFRTTSRTTSGPGPTAPLARCAPACLPPTWASPKTKRPVPRPSGLPITSAVTSPSPRAKDR